MQSKDDKTLDKTAMRRTDWTVCLWIEQIGIAVERARLPDLASEPVVLGDCMGGGAVTAVSSETAAFGIRPGLAISTARALCEDLVVLPYDRLAYEVAAEAVWNYRYPILQSYFELKRRWGVSIAVMVRRSRDVGAISPWQYEVACKEVSV